jgi:hypothetical protein
MANQQVFKVWNANLPGGEVTFTEEEVVTMAVRHEDVRIPQVSQTGNLTMAYIDNMRYEFDVLWYTFFQNTLVKLHMIFNLRSTFIFYPFLLESPLSSFECVWPQPPAREQWVRGRRQAHWEWPITWVETKIVPCPPVEVVS